ncbi:MAG TPA: EamA family transporter, partial [Thermoanaerobaculia bacterium]|nr:EamA family transporter [Thermoanaerobaculia bacterium]
MKHERGLALAAFVTVCIVWGTTYLGIRIAVETIPPLMLTGIRYVAAGSIMVLITMLRRDRFPRDPRTLLELAFIGFLMVGVGNLAVVWAEQWVPSGIAALAVATAPFWMVLLELFRTHGERVDRRGAIGMLIGFAGVAMLVTPKGAGGAFDAHFVAGMIVMQLGSVGWQLGTMRAKYHLKDVAMLPSITLQMLFGGVTVLAAGIIAGEPARLRFTPRTAGALAYLVIFGSVVAYSAYVFAISHMATTKSSLYAYINPLVAVVLGWVILHEQLTWVSIVAMVVILGGVALVQFRGVSPRV